MSDETVAADRNVLAARLRASVLERLAARPGEWVPIGELRALAPEGRVIAYTEPPESERPYAYDDAAGAAYDAGPSGKPDGSMLAGVMHAIRQDLLADVDYPLAYRLYDPDEMVGLGEIARRLGVKRDTADHWRVRRVLPEPDPADAAGRRPRWRWHAVRSWAFETGRDPRGPNGPRWNGRNGEGSGILVDAATSEPIEQGP